MNQLRTIFLLGVLSAVLIGLGGTLGTGYLYGFTALALIINFGSYFFSDRIVLAMRRAQELEPDQAPALHRIVEEVSAKAGIPKPRVFLIPTMADRAMQALHLLGLESVAEMQADNNVYGFRPKRSTADAIERCFIVLARKSSAQWIFEGDI